MYIISAFVLLVVVVFQFLGARDPSRKPENRPPASRQILSPFGESVYRQEEYYEQLEPGIQCKPKNVFAIDLPVSYALKNMALEAEAKRMAAEFEYSKEDLNKGVKEFIQEMQEGLEKQGTMMSQIPTYVTSVPNGTEKVRFLNGLHTFGLT